MDMGAICYQRYLSGDDSGLEELVLMYNDSLIFYINGFINNVSVSEDVAADTFVELITKKNRFTNKYLFKTWLFRIARNNAIDYLRKQSRRRTKMLTECERELSDNETLESTVLQNEQNRQLHNAMKNMSNDYRDVLHLIYFESMSYDDASAVLGKNNKQIKNLVYRAKQALKTTLDKDGFEYEDI
jgi:RNA polymerase sigma-70 factor (ECF subfamily)